MTTEFYYCSLCEEPVDILQGEDLTTCARCKSEVCYRCIQRDFYVKNHHICKRCLKGWFQYARQSRLCRLDESTGREWMVSDEVRREKFEEWVSGSGI